MYIKCALMQQLEELIIQRLQILSWEEEDLRIPSQKQWIRLLLITPNGNVKLSSRQIGIKFNDDDAIFYCFYL